MTGQLLTARDVAELLGATPATVLRWTRNGELPAFRLPSGAIRYREVELDAWLEERATPRRGAPATTTGAALPLSLSSAPPATTTTREQT